MRRTHRAARGPSRRHRPWDLGGCAGPAPTAAFPTGPLSTNVVARAFARAPAGLRLPDIALIDEDGRRRRLSELRGRAALVTLWAEWCPPCLAEIADLAALAERHRAELPVLAVLTASRDWLTGGALRARLEKVHAGALPSWSEPAGGAEVLKILSGDGVTASGLPCTVLADREGRVRARMIGLEYARADRAALLALDRTDRGSLTERGAAQLGARTLHSLWAEPDADALLSAVAAGALDGLAA